MDLDDTFSNRAGYFWFIRCGEGLSVLSFYIAISVGTCVLLCRSAHVVQYLSRCYYCRQLNILLREVATAGLSISCTTQVMVFFLVFYGVLGLGLFNGALRQQVLL